MTILTGSKFTLVAMLLCASIGWADSSQGVLFSSAFSESEDGDFPSSLEFRGGGMQIDRSRGDAMLRIAGNSWFHVPIPSDLPEDFAIEFDYYTNEDYSVLFVAPFDAEVSGQNPPSYSGYREGPFHFFALANTTVGAAVDAGLDSLPRASAANKAFTQSAVPIRLEVSGRQARVFVAGEQAVVLPAANISRTNVIEFFYASMGAPGHGYLGNIRVLGR